MREFENQKFHASIIINVVQYTINILNMTDSGSFEAVASCPLPYVSRRRNETLLDKYGKASSISAY